MEVPHLNLGQELPWQVCFVGSFSNSSKKGINTLRNIRTYPCRNLKYRFHSKNLIKFQGKGQTVTFHCGHKRGSKCVALPMLNLCARRALSGCLRKRLGTLLTEAWVGVAYLATIRAPTLYQAARSELPRRLHYLAAPKNPMVILNYKVFPVT